MKLKKAYIEITNACNLSCEFCKKTRRTISFMSADDFSTAAKQVKAVTDYVYLHVLGEPLLHPELPLILDICGEAGLKAFVTTNGTLLKSRALEIINKPALKQLNISLHCVTGGMDAKTYISGIFDALDFLPDSKYAVLRFWNLGEPGVNKNSILLGEIARRFGISGKRLLNLSENPEVRLKPNIYIQADSCFIWPDAGGEIIGTRGTCYGLSNNAAVLADGTVVPCCLDAEGAIPLGNIFRTSLEEILNSEPAKKMRAALKAGRLDNRLCQTCGFVKRLEYHNAKI